MGTSPCAANAADRLGRSGDVWLYKVHRHKNRWRSQPRVVALGPEAQKILKRLLRLDGGYLFSPRDGMVKIKAARRTNRTSPMTPSQGARDRRNAKKAPSFGNHYGIHANQKAIHRACDETEIDRWSPNRPASPSGTRTTGSLAGMPLGRSVATRRG